MRLVRALLGMADEAVYSYRVLRRMRKYYCGPQAASIQFFSTPPER